MKLIQLDRDAATGATPIRLALQWLGMCIHSPAILWNPEQHAAAKSVLQAAHDHLQYDVSELASFGPQDQAAERLQVLDELNPNRDLIDPRFAAAHYQDGRDLKAPMASRAPGGYEPLTPQELRDLTYMVWGAPATAQWRVDVGEPLIRQYEKLLQTGERPHDPARTVDPGAPDATIKKE